MSDCIFCKIGKGEIPSHKIYEDDKSLVFLDINPTTKGQCLVIPKKHTEYIFDLDDETYQYIFSVAKKIAKPIDKALNPIKTAIVVEGFDVAHCHIKLMPCYEHHITFKPMEDKPNEEEFKEIAESIKKHL